MNRLGVLLWETLGDDPEALPSRTDRGQCQLRVPGNSGVTLALFASPRQGRGSRWTYATHSGVHNAQHEAIFLVTPPGYRQGMPRISTFYGIVIAMFWDDHPPPHFHVQYGEHQATISIQGFAVAEGAIPRRALRLVHEWASIHQHELRENWRRAQMHEALVPIDPLP